jgi:hypothetical protein
MLVNDTSEFRQAESQILHPGTRSLYRYWEAIRAENAAPNRDDLDLTQITKIVPNLLMLERDHMRQTYKWRLAGTQTCQLYRKELTGTDALAGWDSFERDTIKKLLDTVVTSLQPCLIRYRLTTTMDQVIGAEMIGLPLHARNGSRFHVFGGIFPFRDLASIGYDGIKQLELSGARTIWTDHLPGDKLLVGMPNSSKAMAGLRLIQGGRDS